MGAFILLLGIFGICSAVDIESSKEGGCLSPAPKSIKFNISAFMDKSKSDMLYMPMMSKYVAYHCSEDLIGKDKLKDTSEEEIKKSCMMTFEGNDTIDGCVHGFKGREICYELNPESKDSTIWRAVGNKDWEESWITKVCEKYFVAVDCWANGQRSFMVSSNKKALSSKDKSDIIEHVKSLGFKSEFFYELNYDDCK